MTSFDMSLRDAVVIVPLVLVILAFALFPQPALDAGEPAVHVRASARPSGDAATAAR